MGLENVGTFCFFKTTSTEFLICAFLSAFMQLGKSDLLLGPRASLQRTFPPPLISHLELLFHPGHYSECQTVPKAQTVFWVDYGQVAFGVLDTTGSEFLTIPNMPEILDTSSVKQKQISYLCAPLCSLFKVHSLHLDKDLTIGYFVVPVISYLLPLDASYTLLPEQPKLSASVVPRPCKNPKCLSPIISSSSKSSVSLTVSLA